MLQNIREHGARLLNMHRVGAHSPSAARALFRLVVSLMNRTQLAPRMRELVILRVAHLSGSRYEWIQHVPVALGAGVTQTQVEAVADWPTSQAFSHAERAALQYTDEVSRNVHIRDETFKVLRNHHDEPEVVELTLVAAFWSALARFLVALEVDIERPL